jgi:hypothetical protein
MASWHAAPSRALLDALNLLAMQRLPDVRVLFADGLGYGLGLARRAVARLLLLHGSIASTDIVRGALSSWRSTALDRIGSDGFDAIERLLLREFADATAVAKARCPTGTASVMLPLGGHFPRPPPSDRLRN